VSALSIAARASLSDRSECHHGYGQRCDGRRRRDAYTPVDGAPARVEPWITKHALAAHLGVSCRWIELQQRVGLPHLRMGAINRYSISEVEAWLRERYASPSANRSPDAA
jgi:hypothetical protein